MKDKYLLFKLALLQKYPACEICGIRPAVEVNHCLYHVHGGIFDSNENCQAVCHECHNQNGHSRVNKVNHWYKRKSEGYPMQSWNLLISENRREWW